MSEAPTIRLARMASANLFGPAFDYQFLKNASFFRAPM
jgi:hypothetical protein